MTDPFSARLKGSTATIHDEVEHTDFMVELMEGRLDAVAYATLLTQYEVIYAALEARARDFAALDRVDGIDVSGIAVTTGAQAYAEHLAALGTPEQMIAHHYTRYLGDLSGGQAIGTLMGRHYGLPEEALTMWDFTALGKGKPYKDAYRSRLDGVAATGGDEEAVIAETLRAFDLNGALLSELTDRSAPVA